MARLNLLEETRFEKLPVTIYSDSQYVVNSINKGWLNTWMKTNFKGGKKNPDLWKKYHALAKDFSINIVWVKGHADNEFNNRCDELATVAADGKNLEVDVAYEREPAASNKLL